MYCSSKHLLFRKYSALIICRSVITAEWRDDLLHICHNLLKFTSLFDDLCLCIYTIEVCFWYYICITTNNEMCFTFWIVMKRTHIATYICHNLLKCLCYCRDSLNSHNLLWESKRRKLLRSEFVDVTWCICACACLWHCIIRVNFPCCSWKWICGWCMCRTCIACARCMAPFLDFCLFKYGIIRYIFWVGDIL